MSGIPSKAFDPSLRLSEREAGRIDPNAFLPHISAVMLEPSNRTVLLVPSDKDSLVLPSTGIQIGETVQKAFTRLVIDELGMSGLAIKRVAALRDRTHTESAVSGQATGMLEQHVGLAVITEGMPSAPGIEGAEWILLETAPNRLGNNPNTMQRDLGTLLLDRFVATL